MMYLFRIKRDKGLISTAKKLFTELSKHSVKMVNFSFLCLGQMSKMAQK